MVDAASAFPAGRISAAAGCFSWITETIAVGGRLTPDVLADLAAHGVGAVVDLRREAVDDAAALAAQGCAFLHLPTDDHAPPSDADLARGLAFAAAQDAAGRRLLIHCEHGIGRSATLALCILVARGHAPLDALSLMKERRPRVSPSPAQYEAWALWLDAHRQERLRPWTVPDFDAFAAIAYRGIGA